MPRGIAMQSLYPVWKLVGLKYAGVVNYFVGEMSVLRLNASHLC